MLLPRSIKRILQVLFCLLVLVVLLAVSLPGLLSTRRAQSRLLDLVNRELGATQQVSWDRFALGWFGGQRIENLVYRDGDMAFNVESLSIEKGLLALIGRTVQCGQVTIESPRMVFILPAAKETESIPSDSRDPASPPAVDKDRPAPKSTDVRDKGEARAATVAELPVFRMPLKIKGSILVRNGHLQVTNATATENMLWEDIHLEADFSKGVHESMDVRLTAKQKHPTGTGDVSLAVSTRVLQTDGSFDAKALFAEISFEAQKVHLGSMAWIPHEQAGAPMFLGMLDTKLDVVVIGIDHANIDGMMQITAPAIFGGPLGEDRLEPGDVTVTVNARWQDNALRVESLGVDNALLRLQGSGSLAVGHGTTYPAGQLQIDLKADLARLLAQLPATMQWHEGMVLEDGVLSGELALVSNGESLAIKTTMALPHVRARQQETILTFDDFFKAHVALTISPVGPEVEDIAVQTGFASINGRGNLDAFSVLVDVDLDAARQTAAHFVDVGSQTLEGQISFEGALRKVDEDTRSFSVAAASPGIGVGLSKEHVFALEAVRVETTGNLHFANGIAGLVRVSDVRALVQSEPVKLSVTVADIDLTADPLVVPSAGMQWDVDLARVRTILVSAGMLADDVSFAGQLRGAAHASVQDDVLLIAPMEASVTNVRFAAPGVAFDESSITTQVTLSFALPPAEPSLWLTNMSLKGSSFSLHLPEMHVALPADALPLFTLQAVLTADLTALMPHVHNATGAPLVVDGESSISVFWHGPLDPAWENMVRHGQGTGEVRVPRVMAYGMLATNVVASMLARDGQINLILDTAANDGRVFIEPLLDASGEDPLLLVPPHSHVIQNVTLTDEMATELLGLVHPLLRGSSVLGGTVNLTLETCRIPLSETGLQGAALRGVFTLRDLELEAAGLLLQIMETAKLRERHVRVAEQQIVFYVKDGRIHSDPLALKVAGHALSLAGSVGLDASLDYKVLVPVSEANVGGEAFRFLEGQTLTLPIGGTVMRPKIARDAFAQAIAAMAADAVKAAIREERREATQELQQRAEDALRDLLRKRR
ncbi:MAG: hypothetical protein ACNA71_01080 [Kiritimatiellia bacterium]